MVTYFDIGISGTSTEVVTDITFEVISTVAHNIIYDFDKKCEGIANTVGIFITGR